MSARFTSENTGQKTN